MIVITLTKCRRREWKDGDYVRMENGFVSVYSYKYNKPLATYNSNIVEIIDYAAD